MATAKLQAVVTTKGVNKANGELNKFTKASKSAEKGNKNLASSFKGLIAPIAALVSVSAGLSKLVSITRQFDVLNAQLITSAGSAENAALAFGEIEKFASRTPFQLEQSVTAFTKLVNLGLTPSERALTSYGDTASAMGKDLNQLIEAVADAATGEFERLKEFGIKARSEGDNVAFTFRGVTTTVRKNSAEIEEYLTALGENNFSGAMTERMNTLDGAISNLGDQWDSLFRTISSQGTGDLIESAVRTATDAIATLEDNLASGRIEAYLTANASRFDSWAGDVAYTLSVVDGLYSDFAMGIGSDSDDLTESVIGAFSNMPENIRAFIQIMSVELATFVEKTSAYGTEILENIKFWEDESFDLESRLKILDDVRLDSISTILQERDAGITSFQAQVKEADNLLVKYKELQSGKPAVDLAQFAVLPEAANDPSGDAKLQKQKEAAQKQLEQFIQLNNTELEEVDRVESERLEKLRGYKDEKLIIDSEYQLAKKEIELAAEMEREELRQANFEKQKARYEEENALAIQLGKTFSRDVSGGLVDAALAGESMSDVLLTGIRDVAAGVIKASLETFIQQKIVDKLMTSFFVASKVAETSATTAQAAQNAFAATAAIPIVGPALAPAAAATAGATAASLGAAVVSAASAREQGGMLASGQTSTVAERGLEILTPANASRVRTANDMKNIMGESNSAPNVNIVVIDQSEGTKEFDQSTDDEGRIVLLIRNTVSGDLSQSNSQISKSLGGNTTAQRRRA